MATIVTTKSSLVVAGGGSATASGALFSTSASQYGILTASGTSATVIVGSATFSLTSAPVTIYVAPSKTVSTPTGGDFSWVVFQNS